MCVVSMVMDHYWEKWQPRPHGPVPWVSPGGTGPVPMPGIDNTPLPPAVMPTITKEEVEEFRKLLERAREYDRRNNEPDCEIAEKRDRLKKLAKDLGLEIEFV